MLHRTSYTGKQERRSVFQGGIAQGPCSRGAQERVMFALYPFFLQIKPEFVGGAWGHWKRGHVHCGASLFHRRGHNEGWFLVLLFQIKHVIWGTRKGGGFVPLFQIKHDFCGCAWGRGGGACTGGPCCFLEGTRKVVFFSLSICFK